MVKKNILLFSTIFICSAVLFFIFYKKHNISKNGYNTVHGALVTKNNFCSFIPNTPKDIEYKAKKWFATYPAGYDILVKQRYLLTEVGNLDVDVRCFFELHQEIKNFGGMNYIFKIFDENLVLKISGPTNRFHNTAMDMGLGNKVIYFRRFHVPTDDKKNVYCKCVSFEKDKIFVKNYLLSCLPKAFLHQKPSRAQLETLAYMICGSLAENCVAGAAEYAIYETYLDDEVFCPETMSDAINMFIDCAFETIKPMCYKKSDIAGKCFGQTYNTTSRMFHIMRFNEAIELFNLTRIAKAPESYLINVNPQESNSISDKDVVFVQRLLQGFKTVHFYLQKDRNIIDEIFDAETIFQLCKAIEYSGLWDINGDNILIDPKSKKIVYMDFEHNRDVTTDELFNGSVEKVAKNVCQAMVGLLKLFRDFPKQIKAIYSFDKVNNLDLEAYIDMRISQMMKKKRTYTNYSPLGILLFYKDASLEKRERIKNIIYKKLKNA